MCGLAQIWKPPLYFKVCMSGEIKVCLNYRGGTRAEVSGRQ